MSELMSESLLISGEMTGGAIVMDRLMPKPSPKSAPKDKFGEGDFVVELEDAQGRVFYENYFSPYTSGGPFADEPRYTFRVLVPDEEDTASINFKRRSDEHLLYQYTFDDSILPEIEFIKLPPPVIEADFDIEILIKGGQLVIDQEEQKTKWIAWLEASSSDNDEGWSTIRAYKDSSMGYLGDDIYLNATVSWDGLYPNLPFDKMRLGFYLYEGDSYQTINYMYEVVDGTFDVAPWPIEIEAWGSNAPISDQYFKAAGDVMWPRFIGRAGESEELLRIHSSGPMPDITWFSSRDGELGDGHQFHAKGMGELLSPGFHEISVELKTRDNQLIEEHVTTVIVINEKPEIVVRQGDGSADDLKCNELEVDISYGYDLIDRARYAFNADQGNPSIEVTDLHDFPIRYQMTNKTHVDVHVSTTIGYTSNVEQYFYPIHCSKPQS